MSAAGSAPTFSRLPDVTAFTARYAAESEDTPLAIGSVVAAKYEAFARLPTQSRRTSGARTSARAVGERLEGSLDIKVAGELAAVLGGFTAASGGCYFAVWEGYAEYSALSGPRVLLPPQRRMLVFTGAIAAVKQPVPGDRAWRRPVRWWAGDGAWQVGADIYSTSVLVGGSSECVEEILARPGLHADRVVPYDRLRIEDL